MNKVITTIIAIAVIATAAATVVGFTVSQPAYAQLEKDPGASFFAPKADPDQAAGGWMPMEVPGTCIGCAEESSPGVEGLTAGIIGPM